MSSRAAFDADVLILGAGAAGLAAASRLAGACRVLVLEGRERIGGRIFTHRTAAHPLPIDLGPEFIHGRPPETFGLLTASGLVACDIPFNHYDAKEAHDDESWQAANDLIARMRPPEDRDETFADYLARHPDVPAAVRERATAYVEGFNAARADRIGVRALLDSQAEEDAQDGDRQHRLVGGYDQLIHALARPLVGESRVACGMTVRRVEWSRGHVRVTADTAAGVRTFAAPVAIVALPLGVLQQPADAPAGVRFEPDLPARAALRDGLVMGQVHKITLQCDTPFWEDLADRDATFLHVNDASIPVWWSKLPLRTNLLVGWVGGTRAEAMPGDTPTLHRLAVESLARLFDRPQADIADRIVAVYAHDWASDRFSRGAYSYVAAHHADAPDRAAVAAEDTLVFAGEHTHRGLIGTVAGAIRTGYRAAEEVRRLVVR